MILMLLVPRWNLSTKEERMLRTSWMAETMIGANDGFRLDPDSFWRDENENYYRSEKNVFVPQIQ